MGVVMLRLGFLFLIVLLVDCGGLFYSEDDFGGHVSGDLQYTVGAP